MLAAVVGSSFMLIGANNWSNMINGVKDKIGDFQFKGLFLDTPNLEARLLTRSAEGLFNVSRVDFLSKDDRPLQIQNVVINNNCEITAPMKHINYLACKKPGDCPEVNPPLNIGQTFQIDSLDMQKKNCGMSEIVKAVVNTDKGSIEFNW
jgi:hypothetical protein